MGVSSTGLELFVPVSLRRLVTEWSPMTDDEVFEQITDRLEASSRDWTEVSQESFARTLYRTALLAHAWDGSGARVRHMRISGTDLWQGTGETQRSELILTPTRRPVKPRKATGHEPLRPMFLQVEHVDVRLAITGVAMVSFAVRPWATDPESLLDVLQRYQYVGTGVSSSQATLVAWPAAPVILAGTDSAFEGTARSIGRRLLSHALERWDSREESSQQWRAMVRDQLLRGIAADDELKALLAHPETQSSGGTDRALRWVAEAIASASKRSGQGVEPSPDRLEALRALVLESLHSSRAVTTWHRLTERALASLLSVEGIEETAFLNRERVLHWVKIDVGESVESALETSVRLSRRHGPSYPEVVGARDVKAPFFHRSFVNRLWCVGLEGACEVVGPSPNREFDGRDQGHHRELLVNMWLRRFSLLEILSDVNRSQSKGQEAPAVNVSALYSRLDGVIHISCLGASSPMTHLQELNAFFHRQTGLQVLYDEATREIPALARHLAERESRRAARAQQEVEEGRRSFYRKLATLATAVMVALQLINLLVDIQGLDVDLRDFGASSVTSGLGDWWMSDPTHMWGTALLVILISLSGTALTLLLKPQKS